MKGAFRSVVMVCLAGAVGCTGFDPDGSSSSSSSSSSSGAVSSSSGPAPSSSAPSSSSAGPASSSLAPSSGVASSSGGGSSTSAAQLLYTLVIMPDTQNYVRPDNNVPPRNDKELYLSEGSWIRDHRVDEKLVAVIQEGDLTNFNLQEEYDLIDQGLRMFEESVPFFFTLGNHDLSVDGMASDRTTLAGNTLPVSRFLGQPTFGGVFESGSMANSWHQLDAGADHYLLVMMEFAPRDEVLAWVGMLADLHQDRTVILTTHDYLYGDDTRVGTPGRTYDYAQCAYGVAMLPNVTCNNGEDIWNKVVRNHRNIRFVFNGHQLGDGLGKLISTNDDGLPVFQLLVNYQIAADGSLRLMRFYDDGRVKVRAYSPHFDTFRPGIEDQFDIDLVNGVFEPASP